MTEFIKMQSCGNDYIYIDCLGQSQTVVRPDTQWIKHLCDRHKGVGGDGVVYICDSQGLQMVMYNADGSRGKICGNALRCIAHYLDVCYHRDFPLHIKTDAGVRKLDKMREGRYAVNMGFAHIVGQINEQLRLIDVGNRHAVQANAGDVMRLAAKICDKVKTEKLNVETYRLIDQDTLQMSVCEYGTGHTLGCGSGACAVVFDACSRGMCTFGIPVKVKMEGGDVEVLCNKDGALRLRGDAKIVYRGVLDD
jgi:diaminopimelate epimerase